MNDISLPLIISYILINESFTKYFIIELYYLYSYRRIFSKFYYTD